MLDWNSSFLRAICWLSIVKRRASPEEMVALVEDVLCKEKVFGELKVAFEQVSLAGTDVVH